MHLVFGGAYQGKLDYVKDRYGYTEQEIWDCAQETGTKDCDIDFSKNVINHLEEYILECVRSGREAKEMLAVNRDLWKNSVILCTDISSGVVPCDPELRAWREMTGRTLIYLGKEAEEVTRIFCGIPQRIK